MNDAAFQLVSAYGVWIVFVATFLSCLALPIPTSFVMLAGGAFVASGDMEMVPTVLAAFVGAVLGDNAGYAIGRNAGPVVVRSFALNSRRAAVWKQAQAFMESWGGSSVFFSRWLFSPLGPYVNFISGATQVSWPRFALSGAAGEAVWVTVYVGLGYILSEEITRIADLLGSAVAALAMVVAALVLGLALWRAARRGHRNTDTADRAADEVSH
ncbi:MAG: DedA family protein [Pseudomonadota bacterium]